MDNKILYAIAKSRIFVSRLFGLLIILLLLFTGHSFEQKEIVDVLFETSGLILISICSFGRLWSLIYISGYKSNTLITEGPYSIVRHPLYFFSFIGVLGIGLASENVLMLVLIICFYLLYYPFTILSEESKLTNRFGEKYTEYKKRVPRFIPKLSLYKAPQEYTITIDKLARNVAEAMLLVWIFVLLHFIETLQNIGVLPVLLKFP
jgi:protein-S-isoprenylcysteine O-methyltransferase Ste14